MQYLSSCDLLHLTECLHGAFLLSHRPTFHLSWLESNCVCEMPLFLYPSLCWWILRLLRYLCCINMGVHRSFQGSVFMLLRWVSQVGSLGDTAALIPMFWRLSVLLCTVAAPHRSCQQWTRAPFSPQIHQHLFFFVFSIITILIYGMISRCGLSSLSLMVSGIERLLCLCWPCIGSMES